ncbi:MAG TPA: GGDEF domain-containing protein [Tepidisphaeraceae bacterium]|jgi:GGDEF domain-containing protein
MRLTNEHILVVGDRDRRLQSAVAGAMPAASVTHAATVFDAIAELNAGVYSGVLAGAQSFESRPEAAARALREAAGDGRLVLFAEPGHEPLSKQLLSYGIDDYLIGPAEPGELQQVLAGVTLRDQVPAAAGDALRAPVTPIDPLLELPLTDIVLSAMVDHPQAAVREAVAAICERLGASMTLSLAPGEAVVPAAGDGRQVFVQPIRREDSPAQKLVLELPDSADGQIAHHALARIAGVLAKAQQIDDRQARLQRLAITDDLTGVYNARYFKHFLNRILEKARTRRFPVTLFLFDIDNFKKYNDTYGHGVGDEILKQTASLIKRCSRDHDLVARISGDEFAVVFWEKEGPRQPFDGAIQPGRLPATPLMIADRFRKLLGNQDISDFNALGPAGRGVLTISGGMSVYPYDARTADELIQAADHALMFGAKKGGKNSIYLVGGDGDAMGEERPA